MKSPRAAFTLIELMIVVSIIGLLSAIAIPQFLKFQGRAKQSEVKANLKTIYVTEQSYQHEFDSFSESLLSLGYAPERGNRYSYILSAPATYWSRGTSQLASVTPAMNAIEVDTFRHRNEAARPAPLFTPTVVRGPTGHFTVVGIGNVGAYDPLDEWSISSLSRASTSPSSDTACASGDNPSSDPCHDQGPL